MIPLRLKLENFMSHRYTDIDLTDVSCALIVGKRKNDSRKSNGVGKTTIFHGVDFALFGEYPTSTIDKIVRDGTDACKVIFDFKTDNIIYRVIRERNIKTSKSNLILLKYSGDEWSPIESRTQSHTAAELDKIIKINYKIFKQSVLFSQMDLSGLSEAKSSDARRKILKSALSLEVYGGFEKIAKQKLKDVRARMEAHRSQIEGFGDPDKDIALLKKEAQAIDKRIKTNEKSLLLEQEEAARLKKRLVELELLSTSDLSEIKSEISQLELHKAELKLKISKVDPS